MYNYGIHSGSGSLIEIEPFLVQNSFAVLKYFTMVAMDLINVYCPLCVMRRASYEFHAPGKSTTARDESSFSSSHSSSRFLHQ